MVENLTEADKDFLNRLYPHDETCGCLACTHSCGEMAGECEDGYCIFAFNPCATHDMDLMDAIEWAELRVFPVGIVQEVKPGEKADRIGCIIGCEYTDGE